jgi:hypothetical protein
MSRAFTCTNWLEQVKADAGLTSPPYCKEQQLREITSRYREKEPGLGSPPSDYGHNSRERQYLVRFSTWFREWSIDSTVSPPY